MTINKSLRKTGIAIVIALLSVTSALAKDHPVVKALKVERSENNLFISMQIDASDLKLKSDREIAYMPVLSTEKKRLDLPRIIVAGRNRYIQHRRHGRLDSDDKLCRNGKVIHYSVVIPYEEWMETARLTLAEDLCGCGFNTLESNKHELTVLDFAPRIFTPEYTFVTPVAELVKTREAHGSAYIDFPVNRTEINPDYRRNPEELQKIRQTIDDIKQDTDTRIVSVSIEGFASPEGPYANNERLAQGRTAALLDYVRTLYDFDPSIMKSAWTAEDWEGLRNYIEHSSLDDKAGLLAILDQTQLTPDTREWKLKQTYPEQYRFLLDNVYPGLRHSDYAVAYVIRSYTDVEEIKAVLKRSPQKLSLHEMNIVAQSLEPGSDDYCEVFEIAVRMYPDDPVANLNAANIALGRNELERAAAYLAKAGESPEATYARGIYAAKNNNDQEAVRLFETAAKAGIVQASDAIDQLRTLGRTE